MIPLTCTGRQLERGERLRRPRGAAYILSLFCLMLFSTLAVGFYASSATQAQIAANDERVARAMLAAESGLDFMRYRLGQIRVPQEISGYALIEFVSEELADQLDDTANLQGNFVEFDGQTVFVPPIELDGGRFFTATVGLDPTETQLVMTVTGSDGSETAASRSIRMDFRAEQRSRSLLDLGFVTRSVLTMDSNARIRGEPDVRGKVVSTNMTHDTPVILRGNSRVSGDVYLVNPEANVSVGPSSRIAGSNNSMVYNKHIHRGIEEPEFPTIDTDPFKPFAGNDAGYGGVTITPADKAGETKFHSGDARNILIKASPHPDHWVVFDSNMTIDGVIYIETPNKVRFDSNVHIRGAIVVQNYPSDDYFRNHLLFGSNVTLGPIESLAGVNDAYFPPAMTSLVGSSILAPNFTVRFNSNFGSDGGTIVGSRMHFDSNASGTVRGSVINLEDSMVSLNSNADIVIAPPANPDIPAGLVFSRYFAPVPETYEELR